MKISEDCLTICGLPVSILADFVGILSQSDPELVRGMRRCSGRVDFLIDRAMSKGIMFLANEAALGGGVVNIEARRPER